LAFLASFAFRSSVARLAGYYLGNDLDKLF
jgi:hypothetical protein